MTPIICTAIVCVTVLCWRWMELRHLRGVTESCRVVEDRVINLHNHTGDIRDAAQRARDEAQEAVKSFQSSNLSKDIDKLAEAVNGLTGRVAALETRRAFGG
jgi:hypothetical protein